MTVEVQDLAVLSPESLKKVVYEFVPNELIPANWSCTDKNELVNLQNLLDLSNGKLKKYGNAEELAHRLLVFRSFPGSFIRFDLSYTQCYEPLPPLHNSLNQLPFLYKTDLFCGIQGLIAKFPLRRLEAILAYSSVAYFLKLKESKFKTFHEMVSYKKDSFDSLYSTISLLNERFKDFRRKNSSAADSSVVESSKSDPLRPTLTFENLDEVFTKWKEMLHKNGTDRDGHEIFEVLRQFNEKVPFKDNEKAYENIYSWVEMIVTFIDKFISENEFDYLPRSEGEHLKAKAIVRLFESGKERFVMAHELLNNLKQEKIDVTGLEQEVLGMPSLATFSFREVFRKVSREALMEIDFVVIKISNQKQIFVPIPTIDGGYCLPASTILFDIFSTMIHVKKVFQRMKQYQWKLVEQFFESIEHHFNLTSGPYFINFEDIDLIKNEMEQWFQQNFESSRNTKEVRDVGPNGFTVDDLKEELIHLEVTDVFPEIIEHTEKRHIWITKDKSADVLRTCDMVSAIEDCQFICISSRLPKLGQFIHNQNSCHLLINCFICNDLTPENSDSNTGTPLETISEAKQENNDLASRKSEATSEEVVENIDTSSPPQEAVSTLNTTEEIGDSGSEKQRSDFETKPMEKKTKTKKVKKQKASENNSESTDIKLEEKESNSCPKCYRASEFHRERMKLLIHEKKNLKKKMSEIERENEEMKQRELDKDKRIQELEKMILSQALKLADNDKQIQNLEVQHQELQENQRNAIIRFENAIASTSHDPSPSDPCINTPSTSSESEPPTVAEPKRSPEDSEKVRVILYKLLDIQDILHRENPISTASEISNRLKMKSNEKDVQLRARHEFKVFSQECNTYSEFIEKTLQMIRSNQLITADEIPTIPEFPSFSKDFMNEYKKAMKSDFPKICKALLETADTQVQDPNELTDKECLFCLDNMHSDEETLKCVNCKRRYHSQCISGWLTIKRICPTCKAGFLDPDEFPPLS